MRKNGHEVDDASNGTACFKLDAPKLITAQINTQHVTYAVLKRTLYKRYVFILAIAHPQT